MNDFENMSEKNKFHLDIIGQIWGKMASEIYNQYLQRGRGVVVMFMMDDLPAELKAMGGQQHPVLGNYGVMSAKNGGINAIIMTTILSFIWYQRG